MENLQRCNGIHVQAALTAEKKKERRGKSGCIERNEQLEMIVCECEPGNVEIVDSVNCNCDSD